MNNKRLISLLKQKEFLKFSPFNIKFSEVSRHGFVSVQIWEKNIKVTNQLNPVCECAFKIKDNYIRAVETCDFDSGEAITTYHNGLHTRPEYRRQGLATTLYLLVEKYFDLPIRPSNDRTEEAISFWSQPNRPFGEDWTDHVSEWEAE